MIIKLDLDYGNYPLWLCNDKLEIIENGIDDEIDEETSMEINNLMDFYNSLFYEYNDEFIIRNVTDEEKKFIINISDNICNKLNKLFNGKYIIINQLIKKPWLY